MGVVQSAVNFVFQIVRTVVSTVRNWLVRCIEPVVSRWIGSKLIFINSANNPEYFGRAATCKREKEEINREYQKNRNLLSANDKRNLDNLYV